MIGQTILHYKILEKVGGGGMGVVYKAEDIKLKRTVALKFLPSDLTRDEEAKQRFMHEAQAASALDHPNICTIYEIDETEDGQMFIVMAYYEGETLKKKVASGQLSVNSAIVIAIQIVQGMAKAHEHGIVHRDLKPANVMITNDGVAKIVDFGLAKLAGQTRLTKTGMTVGTVAYMSPEQGRGEEVDHRTDIWALGVVLYEMLTGQLPFKGEYEQAVIYSILNEEPEPASSLRTEISSDFEQVIAKALEKDAKMRYASATELLQDLENLKSAKGVAFGQVSAPKTEAGENSVAVVDFSNITGDTAVDWLSGGIAETVTVDLKKISALKVVSREKVSKALARFAGQKITEKHVIDLGHTLPVRWIVWGGYQKLGHTIRITAHFTEVSTGDLIGSAKIDGTMEDIFKLQDEIITTLMDTLQFEISGSEMRKFKTPETPKLQAYEYYAKGRQLFHQFGKASWDQAQELFEKAIAVDPQYALAYSGLGSIHIFRFIDQTDPRDLDIGISHLQKALQYDPDLADPYLWLSYAYLRKQQFDNAIDAGRQAAQLDSDNFSAYYWLGAAYMSKAAMEYDSERYTDAIQHLKKSISLQANFEPSHMILAWIYMLHGQYQEAQGHLEKAVEIEESGKSEGAKFLGALTMLGNLYFRRKQLDAALDWYQRALLLLEKLDHVYRNQFIAWTYCGLGDIHFSRQLYDAALQNYKSACEVIEKKPKGIGMGYCLVRGRLGMAKAFHKLGMSREAMQHFQETLNLFTHKEGFDFNWIWEGSDAQAYYDIASYYALTNRQQQVFEYLRKAIAYGWADVHFLESDESFNALRNESEFQKIVEDLKA